MRRDTAGASAGVGEAGVAAGAEKRNTRLSFGIFRATPARGVVGVPCTGPKTYCHVCTGGERPPESGVTQTLRLGDVVASCCLSHDDGDDVVIGHMLPRPVHRHTAATARHTRVPWGSGVQSTSHGSCGTTSGGVCRWCRGGAPGKSLASMYPPRSPSHHPFGFCAAQLM